MEWYAKKGVSDLDNIALTIIEYVPFVLMVFISLPFHELAHAFVANKLGDDTAYYQGRLTLNPFAHLDLFGTISMVLFGYGWAKPVPVNPTRFRGNMRRGMAMTAFAGPVSNLILAFAFIVLLKLANILGGATENDFFYFLGWIFGVMFETNIGLAFFNLLPIPPLDGSRVLNYFLPYKAQRFVDNLERYSVYIILGVFLIDRYTGIWSIIINTVAYPFIWAFDKVTFFLGDAWYYPLNYFLY